jgi:hypothetical protein
MAITRGQRESLSSKYTILCPPILFTEIARHGLSPRNPWLNLENIIIAPDWLELVKMDLLTEESAKPNHFWGTITMKSILERSEKELSEFAEVSGENIDALIESEEFYRNLEPMINPLKEVWLSLVENTENLSEEERINRLKEFVKPFQTYDPKADCLLKNIKTQISTQEGKERLQAAIEIVFDTYKADSLEKANQIATRTYNHDPNDRCAAHDKLLRLCTVFRLILAPEEHTLIFNRFLNEERPPISRFSPYALGVAIWNYTIQLYLRENPENAAPKGALRDAVYLLYTTYKNIAFVSGDKWHKKFVDEVPLFEGVRENFIFVDFTTKATIQEGVSRLLLEVGNPK